MNIFGINFSKSESKDVMRVDESMPQFKDKGEDISISKLKHETGEGWEFMGVFPGADKLTLGTFSSFYSSYINKQFENEIQKIYNYREMANYTEIADVIEDATNESTQADHDDRVINLEIIDPELSKNENIVGNIRKEFNNLFYKQITNFPDILWDMLRTYYIDGRVYYERVINKAHQNRGIVNIKKLPSETMDFIYDPGTGKTIVYFQYLMMGNVQKTGSRARPRSIEEARKRNDIIVFEPAQIGFVNHGVFGRTRQEIYGYLDKVQIPYNQVKLLETSVIIYRLIRAPERLVFRIDTGNMPRDKALKYVEKIKQKLSKKQTYDPATGQLSMEPEIFCIRKNTEIPLLDGRYLSLENVIKEHNEGKENWVYSINQETLNVEPGKIVNAAITRKDEKLIRIWIDENSYVDTTHDHKFILRDGSECRADSLSEGQSLMPLYRKDVKISNLNYEKIYNPGTNGWRWTHKIVAGDKEINEVVHHKDYNRFNNSPNNLVIMDKNDHLKLHQEALGDKWNLNYDKQVELIRDGVEKWHSDPENQKRHSEWVTKTNIEQNKAEKMQAVLNTPEVRDRQKEAARKCQIKRWSNPENRENQRKSKSLLFDNFLVDRMCKLFNEFYPKRDELLVLLAKDNDFMVHLKKINEKQSFSNVQYDHINRQFLEKIISYLGFKDYPDFKYNFVYNHKIKKIEYLNEVDDTGCITVEGNHNFAVVGTSSITLDKEHKSMIFLNNSMLENYYLPQSADGRGSQIESVGGNPSGFSELQDLYYFARKMYRAMKYPQSRVTAGEENRSADIMFGGSNAGEISRDEIKWAKFLERQQFKFCREFTEMFLLHLEFLGLKKQYDLDHHKIKITMTPPSNYKEQMEAHFWEARFNSYAALADRTEMSKYYLMRKFLKWSEEDIKENVECMKKDKALGLKPEEETM